ncbi:MAG: ATP-binding cassette domain-containing protein [Magnetococcales bacterium]|nr:ATP-binding cassette domain-containing protein [Magnetococcales bacterium]
MSAVSGLVDEEILLRADGISLTRGGKPVLDRVELTVSRNEILTLIGPNGAGKSTLIKVLLGLVVPDEGVVWRKPGLRIGYVPQRMPVDPVLPLTVERFLELAHPSTPGQRRGVLGETGVEALAGAFLHTLSGGEFQRVMLARTLLRQPELLVLDEPVQGVDFLGEAALYQLIANLREHHGCGILLVSHDLHVVMAATHRVICLNRHLCCEGTPEKVSRHPEFVRLFGEQATRALAVYEHHHRCQDHTHAEAPALTREERIVYY